MAEPLDPYQVRTRGLKQIRQSGLGNLDVCHKRVQYQLEFPTHYGTSEARVVGTAYHAGLELFYRFDDSLLPDMQRAAKEAFFAELERGVPEWDTSEDEALYRAHLMLESYVEGNHAWPEEYRPLGVEQEWFLPGPDGWVFKGSMDLVLLGPDGWHYIVDHKTSGKGWKKGKHTSRSTNQPALYVWAWRNLWAATHDGEVPNVRFFFDIIQPDGAFERREAHPTANEITLVLAKAYAYAELVDKGGPFLPNQSSFLCHHKYCDWWDLCPYGASFESGVPVELSHS